MIEKILKLFFKNLMLFLSTLPYLNKKEYKSRLFEIKSNYNSYTFWVIESVSSVLLEK